MLEFKEVQEQTRTYYFGDRSYTIKNVNKLAISDSTHRLETTDGKKYIVRDNWDMIELDVPKWSF